MPGIVGLIPARAGSVGVPGKNLRALAGRPLVTHTVEAAKRSRLDRVIISTDSEMIAQAAVQAGAEQLFLRPAELATGTAPAISVVRHLLEFLQASEGAIPDAVFYLQPTSPFRTGANIDYALDLFAGSPSVDSVMSVSAVTEHPSFTWIREGAGLRPAFPAAGRPERRQDLVPLFIDNNAIMLSRTSYLLGRTDANLPIINTENFLPMVIDGALAIDIDTELQFQFADFLMRQHTERAS